MDPSLKVRDQSGGGGSGASGIWGVELDSPFLVWESRELHNELRRRAITIVGNAKRGFARNSIGTS